MADDTIFNYVQDYLSGVITREAFWALAKLKRPKLNQHKQHPDTKILSIVICFL